METSVAHLSRAALLAGGQASLARILNVRSQTVNQWLGGRRRIPYERCVQIEQVTKGEVTRRDLRPDDWQKIWPELTPSAPGEAQDAAGPGAGEMLVKSRQQAQKGANQ
jgi:DNA-binding transcriptional regulator YdaS (Cro superfamily)